MRIESLNISEKDWDKIDTKEAMYARAASIIRSENLLSLAEEQGIPEFFEIYSFVSQIAELQRIKTYRLSPPNFETEANLYSVAKPMFREPLDGNLEIPLQKLPFNYIPSKVVQNLASQNIRTLIDLASEPIIHFLGRRNIGSTVALRVALTLNHYGLDKFTKVNFWDVEDPRQTISILPKASIEQP